MSGVNIGQRRLHNQRITAPIDGGPADVVAWLGAVQAQDYEPAKWGVGMRLKGATDAAIERAFNAGEILRTHVLRPTWHFVTPSDIRWLLALTAPRVHGANGPIYRRTGLDEALLQRTTTILVQALQGGHYLTRNELRAAVIDAGIAVDDGLRMAYMVMYAELEGVVCSGPRRGKQFTYALLDERAPAATTLGRHEALAELAGRFFISRGPATVHDFSRWSGLTVKDARRGVEAVGATLRREDVDGRTLWSPLGERPRESAAPRAHLLSVYDETISGYKDRSDVISEPDAGRLQALGNALQAVVVLDGRIVGTWRREVRKDGVAIEVKLSARWSEADALAIEAAAQRYGEFLGLRCTVSIILEEP